MEVDLPDKRYETVDEREKNLKKKKQRSKKIKNK